MKKVFILFVLCLFLFNVHASDVWKPIRERSGNPILPGWYADPEGVVFGKEYWIYPTLSLLHGADALNYPAELKNRQKE